MMSLPDTSAVPFEGTEASTGPTPPLSFALTGMVTAVPALVVAWSSMATGWVATRTWAVEHSAGLASHTWYLRICTPASAGVTTTEVPTTATVPVAGGVITVGAPTAPMSLVSTGTEAGVLSEVRATSATATGCTAMLTAPLEHSDGLASSQAENVKLTWPAKPVGGW